jgi:transposase InsO family protein
VTLLSIQKNSAIYALARAAAVVGTETVGADITYIPIARRRFAYLSMVMDRFSRRIVGWKMDATMTEELVIGSLKDAISSRQPERHLIHHSDRGGQYAGNRFRGILKRSSSDKA